MPPPSYSHRRQELQSLVARRDIQGALEHLNASTTFRFTALHLFDGGLLSNRYLVDRERADVPTMDAIPVEASYCVYVRDSGQPFAVADSSADARVADHPKRESIRSYCGVPLVGEDGRMFGSVCHFDFEQRPALLVDVSLLEELAPLLARYAAPG